MDSYNSNFAGLNQALSADIDRIAERLSAGRPMTAKGGKLRVGSKGAIVIETRGRKRGSWYSHEAATGGGPLHLIQHMLGVNYDNAVAWGCAHTGLPNWLLDDPDRTHRKPVQRPMPVVAPQAEPDPKEAQDAARMAAFVAKLWLGAVPLAGTLGEKYLVEVRRIPKPATGWAQAVRFHPDRNALIVALTTDLGAVQAVQLVHLAGAGRKAAGTPERPAKQSFGPQDGAWVRLRGQADGPVLLAEGPETGISVWASTGYETAIALGSISKLVPPAGRKVVVCRDDDQAWSPADRKVRDTARAWRLSGINVVVANPWPVRRGDKSDFNDAIQAGGAAAVSARIEAVLRPALDIPRRVPVDEARKHIDSVVAQFFDSAANFDGEGLPPVHAIRADVGIGKSVAARRHAARLLAAMRANGDARTVVIAVPTHKLGDEQAIAFETEPAARAAGLTAMVWRGREALDPDAPGKAMCQNLDAVKDAREVLADVQTTVCQKKGGIAEDFQMIRCPMFSACGYQRQRLGTADLWIVPHEVLFAQKPAALGNVAVLIVDESAWQDGLTGAHGKPLQITLDAISLVDDLPGQPLATDRLMFLRNRMADILRTQIDGPISREAFEVEGFTADMAGEAYRLEWQRMVDAEFHPRMTAAERKEAISRAAGNRTISRFAMLWKAVQALVGDGGPISSGWAELAVDDTENGPVRVVRLKGRRPISKGFLVPTLMIDATLQIDLVRPFWPQAILGADIAAETPWQRVLQVADQSFSKRTLAQTEGANDPEYRAKKFRDMHATVCSISRRYAPGSVLVIAQQDIEIALHDKGNLPLNAETAHHNAVAGQDKWKHVAALIVVGRTQPGPLSVTRIAEALTGSAIPLLSGWYDTADAAREMASGEHEAAETNRHPDPIAEAVRWSICEGELVQIIGRGRGINRTEADPLAVFVLTNPPLPLPVNATLSAKDIKPSQSDMMMAAGGISFENATDAAAAYPALYGSRAAAKHALEREVGAIPVLIDTITGMAPTSKTSPILLRATYHLAGPGKSQSVAWFDPGMVPDPAAWLAERLGSLKACIVDQPAAPVIEDAEMSQSGEVCTLQPPVDGDMEPIAAVPDGLRTEQAGLAPGLSYRAPMLMPPPSDIWGLPGKPERVETTIFPRPIATDEPAAPGDLRFIFGTRRPIFRWEGAKTAIVQPMEWLMALSTAIPSWPMEVVGRA